MGGTIPFETTSSPSEPKRSSCGTRAEEHLSFTIEKNIIYWSAGPLLGSNWTGEPGKNFTLSGNLYWKTDGGAKTPKEDGSGIAADPKFVDAEKGDFRLKPGSPALALGFAPWDLNRVGPTNLPAAIQRDSPRAFPPLPPPLPPRPIAEDFERYPIGAAPSGRRLRLSVEADVPAARILVTDEAAASGTKCLKIVDAPGQKARYNPHFYFVPDQAGTEKLWIGSFALRLGAGAVFYHEWRDAGSPYSSGPSLRIEADGALRVEGKLLTTLPQDRWIGFEIRAALGSGEWELEVKLPGRTPPRRWKNLPCASGRSFTSLRWWGFVSDADAASAFYLDDLSLRAES